MISRSQYIFLNAYHILIDGLYDSIPIILTFMVVAFGGDEKQIGLIVSCGACIGTVGGLCTVFFSQRLRFKQILSLTAILYGAGFLANSFSHSLLYTGFFFVIAVGGHTLFHNVAFSYITNETQRHLLGRAMSDFTAYGDIGRIPLTALAAYIAAMSVMDLPGWRIVCFLYGITALALGMQLLMTTRKRQHSGRLPIAPGKKRVLPSLEPLRNRRVVLSLIASFLNCFSGDFVFVFLPALLLAKNIDPQIFGSFAFGFTFGCFIGKMLCGRMLDRFGSTSVFVVSEILMAGLLVALIMASSLYTVMAVALLLGIVTKGTVPVVQTIITEPLPDNRHYADVFAINSLGRGIVGTITPTMFGLIGSRMGMGVAYMVMAFGSLMSMIPVLILAASRPQKPD